jgi:hypothetical protein
VLFIFIVYWIICVVRKKIRVENELNEIIKNERDKKEYYGLNKNRIEFITKKIQNSLTLMINPINEILSNNAAHYLDGEDINLVKNHSDEIIQTTHFLIESLNNQENDHMNPCIKNLDFRLIMSNVVNDFKNIVKLKNRDIELCLHIDDIQIEGDDSLIERMFNSLFFFVVEYSRVQSHIVIEVQKKR